MLREQLRQETEWKTPKLLNPTPSERVEVDLQKIEAGDISSWMQLTLDLTLEPTSAMYGHDLGANLAGTPGWKAAESVRKNRILEAAVRYLHEGDPQTNEWFRSSNISYLPIAGFHALALLMVMQDPRLDSLTREVWTKWVPILMRFTTGENVNCTYNRVCYGVLTIWSQMSL